MKSIAIFFAIAIATSTAALANTWQAETKVDRMTDARSCLVRAHPNAWVGPWIYYEDGVVAVTVMGNIRIGESNTLRVDRHKAVRGTGEWVIRRGATVYGVTGSTIGGLIARGAAADGLIAQMRVGTMVLTQHHEWPNPVPQINEFRLEGIGKALDECIAFVR